jgi:hypothetical protein
MTIVSPSFPHLLSDAPPQTTWDWTTYKSSNHARTASALLDMEKVCSMRIRLFCSRGLQGEPKTGSQAGIKAAHFKRRNADRGILGDRSYLLRLLSQ